MKNSGEDRMEVEDDRSLRQAGSQENQIKEEKNENQWKNSNKMKHRSEDLVNNEDFLTT